MTSCPFRISVCSRQEGSHNRWIILPSDQIRNDRFLQTVLRIRIAAHYRISDKFFILAATNHARTAPVARDLKMPSQSNWAAISEKTGPFLQLAVPQVLKIISN